MAEYIEREAAVLSLLDKGQHSRRYKLGEIWELDFEEIREAIKSTPTADVRPVVRGFNKLKDYRSLFECSVCGWECDDTMPGDTTTYNFCPNCGAMMEER